MSKIKVGDVYTNNQGCLMTICRIKNLSNVDVYFDDEHDFVKTAAFNHIKNGQVKNPYHPNVYGVGYIGVGDHKSYSDGAYNKTYTVWHDLIRRCYTDFWSSKPSRNSYKDCTMSKEWLNFQNFANWYESQPFHGKNYEIDKDLIKRGNKHYSEELCALIPQELNVLTVDSKAAKGNYPLGVYKNTINGKFDAQLRVGKNKSRYIGRFNCPREAHQAYVIAKEAYVKERALHWRGRIDERVYEALMAWRVNYE